MADKLAATDDCEAYKRRNATQLNKRKIESELTDTRRPTKESSGNNNNNAKDNVH